MDDARSTVRERVRNPSRRARRSSGRPPRRAAGTWRVSSATGLRIRRLGSGRTLSPAASASSVSSSTPASRAICICAADYNSLSRFSSSDSNICAAAAMSISPTINSTCLHSLTKRWLSPVRGNDRCLRNSEIIISSLFCFSRRFPTITRGTEKQLFSSHSFRKHRRLPNAPMTK